MFIVYKGLGFGGFGFIGLSGFRVSIYLSWGPDREFQGLVVHAYLL